MSKRWSSIHRGSDLQVATGRIPNTSGIGLDVAGIELDERGYVKVDACLETMAPDVWAMGDCAGSPQFTHAGDASVPVAMTSAKYAGCGLSSLI